MIRGGAARILFTDEVGELAGGANSLLLLIRHMDRSRFEPLLACPPGELQERARGHGVETFEFGYRRRRMFRELGPLRLPDPRSLLARRRDASDLGGLVRRCGADLLHSNSTAAHLSGCLAARRCGIPVVWHIRYRTSRLLYRTPRPDRMIFLSERFRRWALGTGNPRGSSVIPNGIDADEFATGRGDRRRMRGELGAGPGDVVFCSVARLKPLKGQRELLAAFGRLCARARGARPRLWLVGEEMDSQGASYRPGGGEYRRELEQQVRALGLEDRVRFLGFRHDVAGILGASDVFVLPSHTEAAPRVVLEAMSLGLPVIASAVGGVPEQIDEGRSGLLVAPRDACSLEAALRELLGDAARRRAMGLAGAERVRARFCARAVARDVEELWSQLLASRAPRSIETCEVAP